MKIAVIVGRIPGGALVAGEASDSLADLLPKAAALAKTGKIGKQVVDRIEVVSTWAPPRAFVVPAVLAAK